MRYQSLQFLTALLLGCGLIYGQVDVSGKLLGTVTDPSSAVVPGARIAATNGETGLIVRTTSDERGNYVFPSLPPGQYSIKCETTGFKTFTASGIVLLSQTTVTLPIVLQVGAMNQSVEVSAAAILVDTTTPTIQTTFDEKLMTAMPVWGRDPRETMELLMPGAAAAGTGASYNVPVTSFNGVSGLSNNYRIDGSDVNDYFHGAATAYPPAEDMAEFSVMTNVPDASVARGGGGQVEAVLKSGTNALHGQGWAYLENGGWNANSWQNNWAGIPRQRLSQQWYGGNAGGPVFLPKLYNGKNKTFFFSSYERTSTTAAATFTGQTITNAERTGDFSTSPDGIPVINGVPTPIIPKSMFTKMGNFLTSGTTIIPAPTSGLTTYSWQPTDNETVQTLVGKIDEYISPKHRLFGSLWWDRDEATSNSLSLLSFSGVSSYWQYPNPKLEWSENKNLQSWTINDTYTISASLFNNFIFGVKRFAIPVLNSYSPTNTEFSAADVGVGSVADVKAPDVQRISMPRIMSYGVYNGYIDQMTQNSLYVADNLVFSRGRHTLKMGLEIRQYHEVKYQTWGAGGNFSFADLRQTYGGTGNGIADMEIGLGGGFSQNNTQILDIHYPAREVYLQDSIKMSRRLTLMFGARWEPHFGVSPTKGNFVTFRAGQASTIFPTAPVGLVTVGDQGVPSNLYGVRWGNIGPRASFAWDVFGNGRAALRGGYAWTTDYQYLLGFNSYTNTAPFGVSYSPPTGLVDFTHPYANSYGSTVPFPFNPPLAGDPRDTSLVFALPVNTLGMDAHFNSGQIHQWNFTFDLEPVKSYLISIGYVATRGTHLSESHDANWPAFVPGTSANTTANINSRRPYFGVGFQTITMYAADFNSMYNSLQARFSKRYSYGLTFMGNYTLSTTKQQNGCRYWGNCSLDYFSPGPMNRFMTSFSYDIPIHFASKTQRTLLGGWTLGGTVTGSSGGYGSIADTSCAQFNYGSSGCYATYVGATPYSSSLGRPAMQGSSQIGLTWLDPNAFVRGDQTLVNGVATTSSALGQRLFLGNAIPGIFKGPASFMLNASLAKNFTITEHLKLNYRLETFNTLNHTVLNAPGGTVGPDMSHFGIITSAWSPRTVQMSARVVF